MVCEYPPPNSDMGIYPASITNTISLQSVSPVLYAIVPNNTSEGRAWLPAIMSDGNCNGLDDPSVKLSPSERIGTKQKVVAGGKRKAAFSTQPQDRHILHGARNQNARKNGCNWKQEKK